MKKKILFLIIILCSSYLFLLSQERFEKAVIGDGGGKSSNNSTFLNATIGEQFIGISKNSHIKGYFGFWHKIKSHRVYPTVSTDPVINITLTSSNSGGIVSNEGDSPVIERGICWNQTGNPNVLSNRTIDGSGNGSYTSSITGLNFGTKYYIRAYATNKSGTSYGEELNFTTQFPPPFINTLPITNISYSSANTGGIITYYSNSPITAQGVCWNITGNPTISDNHTTDNVGISEFSSTMSGLKPFTKYYVRAYATNSNGTGYGEEYSLITTMMIQPGYLTPGTAGIPYISEQFTVRGGLPPYTFTASGLPQSLSMSASGLITGTDPYGGTFAVNINITDANGNSGSRIVKLLILPSPCYSFDFSSPSEKPSGGEQSTFVASEDFNNDGNLDIVSVNWLTDNISILLGDGNGSFAIPITYPVGDYPTGAAISDFNGDGIKDIAVCNSGNSNSISIFIGNGDGTFNATQTYNGVDLPKTIDAADFNEDGIMDLMVANTVPGDVSIFLGFGDGTFDEPIILSAGSNSWAAEKGDFNNDGKLDIAVANSGSNDVSIIMGLGDGGFLPAVQYNAGVTPRSVKASDLNGDGNLDLVIANWSVDKFSILYGDGSGGFNAPVQYPAGDEPYNILVEDINSDGEKELAVANIKSSDIIIYQKNCQGNYDNVFTIPSVFMPRWLCARDFNKDGRLDIAVANRIFQIVTIYTNSCSGTPLSICKDITVELTGNSLTITPSDINNGSSEQCNGITLSVNPSTFTCDNLGTNTVTLTATDAYGNSSQCQAAVTVVDGIVPIPPANAGSTVSCLSMAGPPEVPQAIDNCGPVEGVLVSTTDNPNPLTCQGTREYKYSYTDAAGNVAYWTYTYTIVQPDFTLPPDGETTIICSGDASLSNIPSPVVKDYCENVLLPVDLDKIAAPAPGPGNVDIRFDIPYEDCAGHRHVWHYTFHVRYNGDLTPPPSTTTTIACAEYAYNPGPPPDILDACGRPISAVLVPTSAVPDPDLCEGSVEWTYRYTAYDGTTTADWTYTYIIDKSTPPVISGSPANITVYTGEENANCSAAASWDPPSATDACGGSVNASSNYNPGDIFPVGETTVTYNFTDCANNTSSCSFVAKVIDNTAPVIVSHEPDQSASANINSLAPVPDFTDGSSATDNCGGTVSWIQTPARGTMLGIGRHAVHVIARDSYNNESFFDVFFEVLDNAPPQAQCKDIEVTLVNGTASIAPAMIDNGSTGSSQLTLAVSPNHFACSNLGINSVTLTVTDDRGRQSTCTSNVTVRGEIPLTDIMAVPYQPVNPGGEPLTIYLGWGPQSITLNASGAVSYSWQSNPPGFSSTLSNPTVSPRGTTTYTVTGTNAYGCSATNSITIKVVDISGGSAEGRNNPNNNNLVVCHRGNTLNVNPQSMEVHLSHGDHLGQCTGNAKVNFGEDIEAEMDSFTDELSVRLKQNYPNPFAQLTEIQYFVSQREHATLVLTDINGRVVANLIDKYVSPGWSTLIVNGSGLTAGTYILRLESMGKAAMMKIVKMD